MQIWDQTLSQVKKMSVTVVTVGESSPYHNHRYLRMIYIGAGQHHHSHFDHHPHHHLHGVALYRLGRARSSFRLTKQRLSAEHKSTEK